MEKSSDERAKLLLSKWEEIRAAVEPRLDAIVSSLEMSGAKGLASYIVRGGKMFRGFITMLFAEALSGDPMVAEDAAIAIELVQGASLALDDIIDKDAQRRDKPAAWVLYGVGQSAMISLLLVPVALKMIEKYGLQALSYSIMAWESMVRGEIMDAYLAPNLSPADYMLLASLKTGSLFSLSASLGVIAAGHEELAESAWKYGNVVGTSYQLADDIADFTNYVKGLKPKLDPSEELFIKWAEDSLNAHGDKEIIDRGIAYLKDFLRKSVDVSFLPPNPASKLLAEVPWFISRKMLSSAGLDAELEEL